jgi:hypothetical protein
MAAVRSVLCESTTISSAAHPAIEAGRRACSARRYRQSRDGYGEGASHSLDNFFHDQIFFD